MWESAVGYMITGLLSGLLWFLISQSRTKCATPDGQYRVLRYSRFFKGTGFFILGVFIVLAWGSYEMNGKATSSLILGSVLIVIAMSFLAELMFSSVRFNDVELTSVTPWHGMQVVRWDRVSKVSIDSRKNELVVIGEVGNKVRISRLLSGTEELLSYMRKIHRAKNQRSSPSSGRNGKRPNSSVLIL